MTPRQKIEVRLSEVRQRLNEISGLEGDAFTDEVRTEADALQGEYKDLEVRHRAAIVAEGVKETTTETGTPEDRELRALIDGASVGVIFQEAIEHRATSGQEAELQQHLGLAANQVPLALLETRAVTPAPGNVGQNQDQIIPGVFPMACAAFLGVDMPTVPVGEHVYPVLATNATVHAAAEGATAAETTGSFSADVLSPSRLQASFFYSREDRARFAGMDESLRQNLSDALADALDKEVLAGANGLFTGTNLANNAAGGVTDYAGYRSGLAYGRVDGTYAMGVGDIRVVMGGATYAHASNTFRSANAGGVSALEDLMVMTGGVKVSAHVPAVKSKKQNALVRRGLRRDMVAPIWEGVTLIPDEVTKAASGEIVITAVLLHAVKILRADGFYKYETQHTA